MPGYSQLGPNLFVHHGAVTGHQGAVDVDHGAVNVGIVRDGGRALLIDCGAGDVRQTLDALDIACVDRILFTHHHRDQASGLSSFIESGAQIAVPESEAPWFADVGSFWNDPAHRWHLYDFHPHALMLPQSIPVHRTVSEGDTIAWGEAVISVLETPGHTGGSVSYLVSDGGHQCLFSGDAIYGEGQILELYSLQKGWETRDYHGFLGDRKRLVPSLRKLAAAGAEALIPSHGPIMADPSRAIGLLIERLDRCYEQYVAISALRFYFPEMFAGLDLTSQMPIRTGQPFPGFLTHIGTTWIIASQDGAAFVLDCGTEGIVRRIEAMQAKDELGVVEELWITHYHDDHVDALPQFRDAFACPIVADEHVAQIVENPLAWRLPCISPAQVEVDRRTTHGESWTWHEFTLTAYHLPGQTLYHGGLLVQGRGTSILFVGDSFTPSGIDDYCAGNRNFLGSDTGFDACLALVQQLKPDHLLNAHVDVSFGFTDAECAFMRANLAEREASFGQLFPWDHANYGLDEHWVRCHPYEQRASPGSRVQLDVVCTNHSNHLCTARFRPVLPAQWQTVAAQEITLAPKAQGRARLSFDLPQSAAPGRWVIPIDVVYDGRQLDQFREAVLVISDPKP